MFALEKISNFMALYGNRSAIFAKPNMKEQVLPQTEQTIPHPDSPPLPRISDIGFACETYGGRIPALPRNAKGGGFARETSPS